MRTSDLTLSLLAVGLCGSALAQVTRSALTSDFAPPHRVLRAGRFGEMKWEERLLTATSTDGLTFTRTKNIITDQARSPNLIIADGTLYLFYCTAAGDPGGALAVAISVDQGKTWTLKHVEVRDGERTSRPYAPDVRVLKDGRFRLSFNENRRSPSIFYADGTDGVHFTRAGTAYMRTGSYGSLMIGSLTVPIGDAWHMYLRDGNADFFGLVSHGVSSDGVNFTFGSDPRMAVSRGADNCHPSSAVALRDGRTRFYGSPNQAPGGVLSFLTQDGTRFEPEPGMRLALDATGGLEKDLVKDAAVVRLADGTYFMVYVAGIP